MKVSDLRNYGVAMSDAESLWPKKLKKQIARKGLFIVLSHLRGFQYFSFFLEFFKAKRRAKKADYSEIKKKGLKNEAFLSSQMNYISMFSALTKVLGAQQAIEMIKEIMEKTAKEALLLSLPKLEDIKKFDDPFKAIKEYIRAIPPACLKAGCQDVEIVKDDPSNIGLDVTWCVWFELAKLLGVPKAGIPNCYADDLVFPDYFKELGIDYTRTQTLARGSTHCNFRFKKNSSLQQEETPFTSFPQTQHLP